MNGGNGVDTIRFDYAFCGVRVDLMVTTPQTTSCAVFTDPDRDTRSAFENAAGTEFDDILLGIAGANQLIGAGGPDLIHGRGGADLVIGGDGNDTLFGVAGNDVVEGGEGDDALNGGSGVDSCIQGPGTGPLTNCER